MVSDVRNALGGMWEGGKCVPPPPGGEKKNCPSFGYEESCGRSSGVTKSRAVEVFYLMALLCGGGSRALRRPAATASFLQLHALPPRHPPIHRSGFARDRPGLGRAVTCNSASAMLLSNHSQRPAAGSIPAQADARRGLLHERALVHHQGLEEVRRACCHCILLP